MRRTGRLDGRTVTVDGLPVFYRVSTDDPAPPPPGRPPVVLVHGLGVSGAYMVPLARHLAPDFRVFAPDLPGFGRSAKPPGPVPGVPGLADALAAWMDAVGLGGGGGGPAAVMVGNSLGCQILAELALRHGEDGRLAALVLGGPTADPRTRTALRQIGLLVVDAFREPSPALFRVVLRDYLIAGPRRNLVTLGHLLRDRIEDKLPRITVPALVIRGERDPIVPRAWAERVAALLPNGRFIEIPGAAHVPHFTEPRHSARLVRAFVLGLRNKREGETVMAPAARAS